MNKTTQDKIAEVINKRIKHLENLYVDTSEYDQTRSIRIDEVKQIAKDIADIFEEEDKEISPCGFPFPPKKKPFDRKQFLQKAGVEELLRGRAKHPVVTLKLFKDVGRRIKKLEVEDIGNRKFPWADIIGYILVFGGIVITVILVWGAIQ